MREACHDFLRRVAFGFIDCSEGVYGQVEAEGMGLNGGPDACQVPHRWVSCRSKPLI